MWICLRCKREFKNKNQNHYCYIKPKTIDEYIQMQDKEKQNDLFLIRDILKEVLSKTEERISWGMPTYWKEYNIIHFAASKNHIGLYVDKEVVEYFKEDLKEYDVHNGTIRIPYGSIDINLIRRIAKYCLDGMESLYF